MYSVKTGLKVLTQEECEILVWGKPKRRPKRKFLWEMGNAPQGREKTFAEGSTADERLVLRVMR